MPAALALLYRYAPARNDARFSWVSIGAVVATLLWVVGWVGFSVFVSNFGSYGETYGTLAVWWCYFLGFLTAASCSWAESIARRSSRSTGQHCRSTPAPRPAGAVKADSIPSPE